MKFKEIKPGMVIHCSVAEESYILQHHLFADLKNENINYSDGCYEPGFRIGKNDCYSIDGEGNINCMTLRECLENNIITTEFFDLLEPDSSTRPLDLSTDLWCGEWKKIVNAYGEVEKFMCECGCTVSYASDFCPGCGKAMYPEKKTNKTNNSSTEMSAVEVLEWLYKYGEYGEEDVEVLQKVFGPNCKRLIDIFEIWSPQHIVDKITAYEAEKKEKPVELKWVKMCRVIQIQDNGLKKVVYEEDVSNTPTDDDLKGICEDILKEYISKHDGKYIAVIEDVCRVKGENHE